MMRFDHLVVGCVDLAHGTEWLSDTLGVAPGGGGEHVSYGTHNRLWRLDGMGYLELIARKPGVTAERKALFGLSDAAVQARLFERPRLLSWVARVESDLHNARGALDCVPGLASPVAVTRGAFSWQLAVEQDGGLCADGVLPYLIWWQSMHPCEALPETGLELQALELRTPNPGILAPLLARVDDARLSATAGESRVLARIASPGGALVLD